MKDELMKELKELRAEVQALRAERDSLIERLYSNYIDKKEVMRLWGCSGQTVERAAKQGTITKYYLEGQRFVRYKRTEVIGALKTKEDKPRVIARQPEIVGKHRATKVTYTKDGKKVF